MASSPYDGTRVLLQRSLDARATAGQQGIVRGVIQLETTMVLVELDTAPGFARMVPSDALVYLEELDAEMDLLLGPSI